MPEAAPPLFYRYKTHRLEMFLTVVLPITSSVGVSVQSPFESADWVDIRWLCFLPSVRPVVFRNADPSGCPSEVGLGVSLVGVGLLDIVTGQETISISSFGGLHRSRARGHLIKHGDVPVLVIDTIALEDDSTLKLSPGIVFVQFCVLFNTNVEYRSDKVISRSFLNVLPLVNILFIPGFDFSVYPTLS